MSLCVRGREVEIDLCLCSVVKSCSTLLNDQPARLLSQWDFPGKNIGIGSHFLLDEISISLLISEVQPGGQIQLSGATSSLSATHCYLIFFFLNLSHRDYGKDLKEICFSIFTGQNTTIQLLSRLLFLPFNGKQEENPNFLTSIMHLFYFYLATIKDHVLFLIFYIIELFP